MPRYDSPGHFTSRFDTAFLRDQLAAQLPDSVDLNTLRAAPAIRDLLRQYVLAGVKITVGGLDDGPPASDGWRQSLRPPGSPTEPLGWVVAGLFGSWPCDSRRGGGSGGRTCSRFSYCNATRSPDGGKPSRLCSFVGASACCAHRQRGSQTMSPKRPTDSTRRSLRVCWSWREQCAMRAIQNEGSAF